MKLNIKKPEFNRKKKEEQGMPSDAVVFGVPEIDIPTSKVADFSSGVQEGSFGVNVRNAEAGIRILDTKAQGNWLTKELIHELATGLALMTYFAFMLAAAGIMSGIPFTLIGTLVYMILVVVGEKFEERFKYFAAAGIVIFLAVVAVAMRKYLGGGLGTIMNYVYDASEMEQAYIYNKFPISEVVDSHPDLCVRIAVGWVSVLAGTIGAIPPAAVRRAIGLVVAAFAMIAFAYYGLVPSAVIVAIAVVTILFVMTRGSLLAALPVMLASLLLFGAVLWISPGENYAISRADENIRDRLAFRSAYLESDTQSEFPDDSEDLFEDPNEYDNETTGEFLKSHKWLIPLLIALLILGGLGAAAGLIYRRYLRRRAANREGLYSEDDRTAVVAMFPYAIKWLGAGNIDVYGKNFASLVDTVRHDVSDQYSNYYKSMYVLWREAAYSDHEINKEQRIAMEDFVDDTEELIKHDMDFRGKLRTALKYAL